MDALLAEWLRLRSGSSISGTSSRRTLPPVLFLRARGSSVASPLAEGGYFASPPGPVLHPEDGTAEMPFWPESSFLARVASSAAEAAEDACAIDPADGQHEGEQRHSRVVACASPPIRARAWCPGSSSTTSRFGVLVPSVSASCAGTSRMAATLMRRCRSQSRCWQKFHYTGSRGGGDLELCRDPAKGHPGPAVSEGSPRWSSWPASWTRRSPRRPVGWRSSARTCRSAGGPASTGSLPAGSDTDPVTALVSLCGMPQTQDSSRGTAAGSAKSSLPWRHTTGRCSAGSSSTSLLRR